MNKKAHSLWTEKYRPQNLSEYVGNEELKKDIQKYLNKNDIPHLMFYGTPGIGKTTLAKLVINNLDCDHIYLNASDENGIDTIREKVKAFASSATFKPTKVVILDEADRLTIQAQDALKFIIEEYSLNTRFIGTANNFSKIIPALKSRFTSYSVKPNSLETIETYVKNILDREGIMYQVEDVIKVVKPLYPDLRSILKILQKYTNESKTLVVKEDIKTDFDNIVNKLKTKNSKTWYEIRQIVADSEEEDFTTLYQSLYGRISEFAKGNEAQAVIIIDEYLWRSMVIPDKEINLMAMFAKLIENI
jgi:DNA polymerase III delta prime subunit